jgi:two-component system cell cycle response regulator
MRVLLIESNPEDVQFLRDVLMEIGEGGHWDNWVKIEVLEAGSWSEAWAILESEPLDIVLLDLDFPDTQGIETFRRAQHAAQHLPVVLVVGTFEESLGLWLIRDGAQDFLVKKHVDCAPLAHAMRSAIERHRLLTASRASSTHDTLTGLLNRTGFLTFADRDVKLAERLGRRLMVMIAESPITGDEQQRDLTLGETAEHLHRVAGPADLLARIDGTRFGLIVFDTAQESLESARARIQPALEQHRIQTGAAIFSNDHPSTLDGLLEQAATNMAPNSLAMYT